MRAFPIAFVVLVGLARAAAADRTNLRVEPVASPAAGVSLGAAFATEPGGAVWLSWIETSVAPKPAGGHQHAPASAPTAPNAVRFAAFDAKTSTWSPARTIVKSATVAPSSSDFPLVALGAKGAAWAIWTDGRGGAFSSASTDRGATWSAARPWAKPGQEVEKFALTPLADGRILAAWLDGRAHADGKPQQLRARIAGESEDSDLLVDASVCDCCQTTLVPLLDGGALLAYRGRTPGEVRDILVARFNGAAWAAPSVLNVDDWRIPGCPVNGPRLAGDGSHVSAAWFTGADNDPRVLASYSPDAGVRWLAPLRIDQGKPAGHVDTLLLRDGALIVSWLESDGSLWLRRITPEFSVTDAVMLTPKGTALVRGVPRMALLRDYDGGRSEAEILLAYTADGDAPAVRILRITVPEGALLTEERNCDCAPTAEQLQGFALRGAVTAADVPTNTLRIRHAEVPGVFAAGTHDFKVDPVMLTKVQIGWQFLGRIDRKNGTWWLTDVRLLGSPSVPFGDRRPVR